MPEPLRRRASRRDLAVELPGGGRAEREFGFDPLLRDLAEHADQATARMTAKFSEYPAGHLRLPEGAAWPWRSTMLAIAAVALSVAAGLTPAAVRRVIRRRRTSPGS